MSETCGSSAKILLKARPVTDQLSDRLAEPVPEGLELYLDRRDVDGTDSVERLAAVIAEAPVPTGFEWIVEGPVVSLDGTFFSIGTDNETNRETLRRVIQTGARIGAKAANIHLMIPTTDPNDIAPANAVHAMESSRGLLRFFVESCQSVGLLPLVENVPPIGRMRQGAFVFTPIGLSPDDFRAAIDLFPSLRVTLDTSHAQLFLNARRMNLSSVEPMLRPAVEIIQQRAGPDTLAEYVDALSGLIASVHVSNARGLLGEGLWYRDGEADLDAFLVPLVDSARWLVTETLEPNPNHALGMRNAQSCLHALRSRQGHE